MIDIEAELRKLRGSAALAPTPSAPLPEPSPLSKIDFEAELRKLRIPAPAPTIDFGAELTKRRGSTPSPTQPKPTSPARNTVQGLGFSTGIGESIYRTNPAAIVDAIGKAEGVPSFGNIALAAAAGGHARVDPAKGRAATAKIVHETYRDWAAKGKPGDFLEHLRDRYAPIGAGNDPTNLNVNWLPNVLKNLPHDIGPVAPPPIPSRVAAPTAPTPPARGGYLSGGPVSDVFDVLRTGEYAVGGLLSGKGVQRGVKERTETYPIFLRNLVGTGMPPSFADKAAAFAASLVFDPINLIGVGLVGKGLRVAGLVGTAAKVERIGPAIAERTLLPLGRRIAELAERSPFFAERVFRPLRARRALEPVLEQTKIAEQRGAEQVVDLATAIRKDALAATGGNAKDARRLDQALGTYFDAGADTMLNYIASAKRQAQAAAVAVRRQAYGQARGATGEAAMGAAEAVRRQAADVVGGLQNAIRRSLGEARGLNAEILESVLFKGSQAAARAASKGLTARQAELEVAKAIGEALRSQRMLPGVEQRIVAAFRQAAAPLTKGRTAEAARMAAQQARQRLATARGTAEAAEQAAREVSPDVIAIAKQTGLKAQETFLGTLPAEVRAFVQKWAPVVTRQDTEFAEQLVRVGMLKPETAAKWTGLHLRRIYQAFEDPQEFVKFLQDADPAKAAELLGKIERGMPIRRVGQPIPTAVTKARKTLGEEVRAKLGEIPDASSRLVAGGTLASRAVARGEAFREIAQRFAVSEDLVQTHPLAHQIFRKIGADPKSAHVPWGALQGKWVPKEIHDVLADAARRPEGLEKAITWLTGQFKFSKVILNPATHARNVRTNVMLIHNKVGLGGLNPATWVRAWREVATNGPVFREAKSVSSAFIDTFTNSEIRRFIGYGNDHRGLIRGVWGKLVADPMARAYNFEEQLGKMVVYLTGRGRGLSKEASALMAEKTLFNYAKVPPWVEKARRWGFYPFITFPYKVATETIPQVVKRPGRFSQQAKIIAGVSAEPLPEEWRVLPAYMRTGGYAKLPPLVTQFPLFKDAHGRPVYYDLTYELVFGDLGEMGTPPGQVLALLRGDAQAWQAVAPFLTPVGQLVAEIAFNKSLFTGGEIRRRGEEIGSELSWHALRTMMPGGLYALMESGAAKLGLRPEPTSQLAKAVTGTETRTGKQPMGFLPAAAMTFLGMRTVPVDVAVERRARAFELKRAMDDARSELASVAANPNLRRQPELQKRKIKQIHERIKQITEQFREQGYVPEQ